MSTGQSVQDAFLDQLREEQVSVSVFLVNGTKIHGRVGWFDPFVVLLNDDVSQMVYKHAISTIVSSPGDRVSRRDEYAER